MRLVPVRHVDGGVVLPMARNEMGQGVHTALSMLVVEELDLPVTRVSLGQAGNDAIHGSEAMLVGVFGRRLWCL